MAAYNVGDKFIIEIVESIIGDANNCEEISPRLYRIKGFNALVFDEYGLDKLEKVNEEKYPPSELEKFRQEAFEKGMEEAWKIAGLIAKYVKDGGISVTKLHKVFGCELNSIFARFTVKEAKGLIEKHFPGKLNPPSFKVGDIVEKDGCRAIVLDVDEDFVSVWTENRCSEVLDIEKVLKTDNRCDLKPILDFIGKR